MRRRLQHHRRVPRLATPLPLLRPLGVPGEATAATLAASPLRGVWRQPYSTRGGAAILVALDRRGCWVDEYIVERGEDEAACARELRHTLDLADPDPGSAPSLHLVRQ